MSLYLGLDGGGTKTTIALLNSEGEELGRGTGGSGNIATNSDEVLLQSVQVAFRVACHSAGLSPQSVQLNAVCAGVAGYSVTARRTPFLHIMEQALPASSTHLCPDYEIAWWGATQGDPGIVVIAGTGAVAYAKDAKGETAKADGLGYLLGDRGSGFNLGLYALRHTLTQLETGKQDRVSQTVLEYTKTRISTELMHWLYSDFSPARVASLAPKIGLLAEEEDIIARSLVVEMARRLRHTVREVRHRLWLPRDIPVYPLGGLWELGSFFRSEFQEPQWLGEGETNIEPEDLAGGRFLLAQPRHDAAYGAGLCAKRLAETEVS